MQLSHAEQKDMVYLDVKGGIMTAVPRVNYRPLADKGLIGIATSKMGKTVIHLTEAGKAWLTEYYAENRKFTFIEWD